VLAATATQSAPATMIRRSPNQWAGVRIQAAWTAATPMTRLVATLPVDRSALANNLVIWRCGGWGMGVPTFGE